MPIRVLHVVGVMNRGGVETWLMHVFRNIDRERFTFDFLVHSRETGAYDEEILSLGGRIIQCPWPRRPLKYARALRHILRICGPFDIVHSHVHHFSGFVAKLGHDVNVPVRIVHCHSDTSLEQSAASLHRRAYFALTERLIRRHSTVRLAASAKAAPALFGAGAVAAGECRVLYYGIDLRPFEAPPEQAQVRRELGIAPDTLVLGHVGNLNPVKNHQLLLHMIAQLKGRIPSVTLLLVGTGPLRGVLEAKARELGCIDSVLFAGVRADVPRLLMGAVDVFVFPSLWEGLPVAAIEAQAAGIPLVLSSAVSTEVEVVPGLVTWRDPNNAIGVWADATLAAANRRQVARHVALRQLRESAFNITNSVRDLTEIYATSR